MSGCNDTTRRRFVKDSAAIGAAATVMAAPLASSAAPAERVNVGLIGVGIRGSQLHDGMLKSSHCRVAAIADISDHYIDRIRPKLVEPNIPVYRDYHKLLEDKNVEAVVIASPDFWHAQMTLDALDAGKHVYVEKPLTYSLEEAIRVRDKAKAAALVTQVGYQRRSIDLFYEGKEIVDSGVLGEITHIQIWSSRNYTTLAPWRAYNDYGTRGLPANSGADSVDWKRYLANRPMLPYDARRFFHWQCYSEYSTGILGILMSHPLDSANLVMSLGVPETCSAAGGVYKFGDGRTVPDTCTALFNYPSRNTSMTFVGTSNNRFRTGDSQFRGTHGTLELTMDSIAVYAESRNTPVYRRFADSSSASQRTRLSDDPVFERKLRYDGITKHLDDFFIACKTGAETKCPVSKAFVAMVGVAMALESYQQQKTIRWDATHERFVS